MRATAEHVEKLVSEKHNNAKVCLESLLNAIASNNRERVLNENARFHHSLETLGSVVAKEHWPGWLHLLLKATKNYSERHSNGQATWLAHLKAVMGMAHQLETHQWFVDESEAPAFDVDRVIEEARARFKIDELFGRVIETLRALIATGEIDSIKALDDLEEIIRILKRAKIGSFSNQIASWSFAKLFTHNLIKAYVKKSDIVGPIVEAFEETSRELDVGLGEASAEVTRRLRSAAEISFKSIALQETVENNLPLLPSHQVD